MINQRHGFAYEPYKGRDKAIYMFGEAVINARGPTVCVSVCRCVDVIAATAEAGLIIFVVVVINRYK